LLTYREPLGPIDQANVHLEQDAKAILNIKVTPFSEAIGRAPILLLGRKGSGKSSILAEFKILADGRRQRAESPDSPPEIGAPFLINIASWDQFHQLTRHVAGQYRDNNPEFDTEMIPTEYLARLWTEALWDEVIRFFYNFCHHRESRPQLTAVEKYILADGSYSGPPKDAAVKLYEAAKSAVLAYANSRKSKIIFLIDSMEKYPVRNVIFAEVLGGLLRAINNVHYESDAIKITFCLPEEIEGHLHANSANIMKDYNAAYRIRWKPIDLLTVAAHRYRLFAELKDPTLFERTKSMDLNAREGIHEFFRIVMPDAFLNSLGDPEDPLAYIVRHTQLLPRHVIAIFNAIIARSYDSTRQMRTLDAQSIREGVGDAEKLIAQQVLVPYYKIYPDLIAACEDILPDLGPVCTFDDLRKVERRFKNRVEEDVRNVWRALFAMGVLGKVVHASDSAPDYVRSSRYCLAQFHYNIEGSFGLSDKSEYCFHPVFSRHFGVTRKNSDDRKAVYPSNVDIPALK
jgi:hypothetical protein